ncbi:hypothetical protein Scep_023932 [Stephania cephalantha]|uniref:Uncharacterized protein n=1 Tax=Stephania cephalantha TaxID=152367 RepID=A0AAP0F118_9MAGN
MNRKLFNNITHFLFSTKKRTMNSTQIARTGQDWESVGHMGFMRILTADR